MQPNPDPKPGRWILPVVILAMMGFAWLFINAAEDPTISTSDTTTGGSTGGTTTTTRSVGTTTTTTLIPVDVITYNSDIVEAGIAIAGLQDRISKSNSDWDSRTLGYAATLADLRDLDSEVKVWRAGLDAIVVPTSLPEYANFHSILAAAATEVSKNSGDIVVGLQAPDTGEARRAALTLFNESVTAFGTQVNTIAAYEPGADS